MASVVIRGVNDGVPHLPHVCVKTGLPTQRLLRLRGRVAPGWTGWLIVFSIFAWALARNRTARGYNIVVPCRSAIINRWHRWRVVGGICIAIGILGIPAMAIEGIDDPIGSLVFFLLVVGGILTLAVNSYRHAVSVSFTADGDIRLDHVHPTFREAVLASAVPPSQLPPAGPYAAR